MDFNQGLSSLFWQSSDIHICSNPKQPLDETGLMQWAQQQPYLQGHLLIATSGTTSKARWVALSKQALLYAAKHVNERFNINNQDVVALNLPLFHVAGLSILARCYLAQATCHDLRQLDSAGNGHWNAQTWHQLCCKKGITLASLVPTQVADLVSQQLTCPKSMRLVFVGGDQLVNELVQQAAQLGWPLHLCYGMTETSAMLAVENTPQSGMQIMPHWQYQKAANGQAQFKGSALCTGYITKNAQQQWYFQNAIDEQGWFTSDDNLTLNSANIIQNVERHSHIVKILGEKVSLSNQLKQLQAALEQVALPAQQAIILTEKHPRRGAILIPVWENMQQTDTSVLMPQLLQASEIYHSQQNSKLTALEAWKIVDTLERTTLGKKKL